MPIKPENKARYPVDWPQTSNRIRFVRAGGRCECPGDCGSRYHLTGLADEGSISEIPNRCTARHGERHPSTGSMVVLTTMHLNHQPEDCRDENLRAACQACHLAYDAEHHALSRAEATVRRMTDAGQTLLGF